MAVNADAGLLRKRTVKFIPAHALAISVLIFSACDSRNASPSLDGEDAWETAAAWKASDESSSAYKEDIPWKSGLQLRLSTATGGLEADGFRCSGPQPTPDLGPETAKSTLEPCASPDYVLICRDQKMRGLLVFEKLNIKLCVAENRVTEAFLYTGLTGL